MIALIIVGSIVVYLIAGGITWERLRRKTWECTGICSRGRHEWLCRKNYAPTFGAIFWPLFAPLMVGAPDVESMN